MKLASQRQVLRGIPYRWNLKKQTNKQKDELIQTESIKVIARDWVLGK